MRRCVLPQCASPPQPALHVAVGVHCSACGCGCALLCAAPVQVEPPAGAVPFVAGLLLVAHVQTGILRPVGDLEAHLRCGCPRSLHLVVVPAAAAAAAAVADAAVAAAAAPVLLTPLPPQPRTPQLRRAHHHCPASCSPVPAAFLGVHGPALGSISQRRRRLMRQHDPVVRFGVLLPPMEQQIAAAATACCHSHAFAPVKGKHQVHDSC